MNCLFVNLHEPVADSGGIEAVTGILSKEFRTKGINTFCLWQLPGPTSADKYAFDESKSIKNLSAEDISRLLLHWQIDVVIVQAFNEKVVLLNKAIKISHRDVKLLYTLHCNPGWEMQSITRDSLKNSLKSQKFRSLVKLSLYPFFRAYLQLKYIHTYRKIYKLSDKIILLSPHFIDLFEKIYKIKDETKLTSIPNPCRFITSDKPFSILQKKDKIVLIVARLLESQKNLLRALSIWKEIEKDDSLKDWNLTIVGDGPDKGKYLDYIHSNKLKRVNLVGQQNPVSYYSRTAIFMMTSSYEGFPMTLLEAQYYGCVPIVFDTFESLRDIIKSDHNGIIINKHNDSDFTNQLKKLMSDSDYLHYLSNHAQADSIRYYSADIASEWILLFESLDLSIKD